MPPEAEARGGPGGTVAPANQGEDKDGQFWVLPLAKWDKSDKKLSMEELSNKQTLEHANFGK